VFVALLCLLHHLAAAQCRADLVSLYDELCIYTLDEDLLAPISVNI